MQTEIEQWGNMLAIRISEDIAKSSALHKGSVVEVSVVEGKIVAEPVHPERETLEQLLSKITDENRHEEIDFGPPVGREVW